MKNKFRAKGARSNEWIYGAYLKMLPYTPAPLRTSEPSESEYKHLIIKEGFSDWNMPRGIEAFDVLPETVGQCTGLKDKNGKLIYEGDIIKYLGGTVNKKFVKYITKWNDNMGQFYISKINPSEYDNWKDWHLGRHDLDYEVIGNIYDNKELLEK